jgi:hypothetical protein
LGGSTQGGSTQGGSTQGNPAPSGSAPYGSGPYTGQPGTARQHAGAKGGSWNQAPAAPAYAPAQAGTTGYAGPATEARPHAHAQPTAGPREAPRTVQGRAPGEAENFSPRVARLTIASVDPFSALKLSFLLSVAAGIALVIASVVLWLVLSAIGVFDQLNGVLGDLGMNSSGNSFSIYDYVGFGRVVSISIVIGVVNTLLLTALATVSAFLYNLSAGLVGGVRVTLSDD